MTYWYANKGLIYIAFCTCLLSTTVCFALHFFPLPFRSVSFYVLFCGRLEE